MGKISILFNVSWHRRSCKWRDKKRKWDNYEIIIYLIEKQNKMANDLELLYQWVAETNTCQCFQYCVNVAQNRRDIKSQKYMKMDKLLC